VTASIRGPLLPSQSGKGEADTGPASWPSIVCSPLRNLTTPPSSAVRMNCSASSVNAIISDPVRRMPPMAAMPPTLARPPSAEDDPAAGQHAQRCGGLGEDRRRPQLQVRDVGEERDAVGLSGQVRDQRPDVEDGQSADRVPFWSGIRRWRWRTFRLRERVRVVTCPSCRRCARGAGQRARCAGHTPRSCGRRRCAPT
jgi:hypothetical protein